MEHFAVQARLGTPDVFEVPFDQCMHGGKRKKRSSWWTDMEKPVQLAVKCDGRHDHSLWGITERRGKLAFLTKDEAEYHVLLCKRVAEIVTSCAASRGVQTVLPKPMQAKAPSKLHNEARSQAGLRFRGLGGPVVTEAQAVAGVQAAAASQLQVHSKVIAIRDQMLVDRGGGA